mmetsp:Transcript_54024/g.106672  ORF Transcript_54024/g.106672 Transcript_54024/m.106672 type:complete len:395 (-) Transcript_54024:602-1786(-)
MRELHLQHPGQLDECPKFDPVLISDVLDARLGGPLPGRHQLLNQGGLLLSRLRFPAENLQNAEQLGVVDFAAFVLVVLVEQLLQLSDPLVCETGFLPFALHPLVPASIHDVDEGVESKIFAHISLVACLRGVSVVHPGQNELQALFRNQARLLRLVPVENVEDFLELLLPMQAHQPHEFAEIELAAVVVVDLGDENVDLVQGLLVAELAENLRELEGADLPRFLRVKSLEDLPHVLDDGLAETFALVENQHEVEVLVEIECSVVVGMQLLENLVNILLQWGVTPLLQHKFQLIFRDHPIAVQVVLREVSTIISTRSTAREGTLQVFERFLPRLPRKDEELGEAQSIRLAPSADSVRGGLQAGAAAQLFLQFLCELRHMKTKHLHKGIGEQVGWQ